MVRSLGCVLALVTIVACSHELGHSSSVTTTTTGSGFGPGAGGGQAAGGSGGAGAAVPTEACSTRAPPVICIDQCRYVREGATGSGDGSDWANAFTAVPDAMERGHVYFVADGSYGDMSFDDAPRGDTMIVVRKATEAEHGTPAGWSSDYGDGEALFGSIFFGSDFWMLDGVIGGGPGQWDAGFGFKVRSGGHNVHFDGPRQGIQLHHVDIENNGRYTADDNEHSVYGIDALRDIVISHSHLHDVAGVQLLTRGAQGVLVECSKLARNGPAGFDDLHREAWSASDDDDITIRFNVFEDISNTAFLGLVNGNGDAENWQIYGNAFLHSGALDDVGVSGIIVVKYASPTFLVAKNWEIHNNAIVGVQGLHAGFDFGGAASGVRVFNNVWLGNRVNTISIGGAEHDFNWFFDNVRTEGCDPPCNLDTEAVAGEPNAELGTADPFIGWAANDFVLVAPTAPGQMLPAPFDIDAVGAMRGADGVWDRGPYEYR